MLYVLGKSTHIYWYPGYVDGQAIIRMFGEATLFYNNSCVSSAKMLLACKIRYSDSISSGHKTQDNGRMEQCGILTDIYLGTNSIFPMIFTLK